jgi:hypothetical protein
VTATLISKGLPPQTPIPSAGRPTTEDVGDQAFGFFAEAADKWTAVWQEADPVGASGERYEQDSPSAPPSDTGPNRLSDEQDAEKAELAALWLLVPTATQDLGPLLKWNGDIRVPERPAAPLGNPGEDNIGITVPSRPAFDPTLETVANRPQELNLLLEETAPTTTLAGQTMTDPERLSGDRRAPSSKPVGPWPSEPVADVHLRPRSFPAALAQHPNSKPPQGGPSLASSQEALAWMSGRAMLEQGPTNSLIRTKSFEVLRRTKSGPEGNQTEGRLESSEIVLAQGEPSGAGELMLFTGTARKDQGPGSEAKDQEPEVAALGHGSPAEPFHARQQSQPASGPMLVEQSVPPAQALPSLHPGSAGRIQAALPAGVPLVATRPAPAEPKTDTGPARPAGQLDLQVEGKTGERVRIRVTEAPGGLRLRVASNDAQLAESLRAEWQTLEGALRRTGWEPEAYTAEAAKLAETDMHSSGNQTGVRSAGDLGAGHRPSTPAAEASSGLEKFGDRPQGEGHSMDKNETRQEWLDLSALRRLSKRRAS